MIHRLTICRWFAVVVILASSAVVARAGGDLAVQEGKAFRAAVERVAPSIVRIETIGGGESSGEGIVVAPTTGLIVSPEGLIVSSAFGFAHHPDSILVELPDGTRKPARLVATDYSRMIVLLKIEPDAPLSVAKTGLRKNLRVGQWAIAVGRTFEPKHPNVSVGIVSALSRINCRAFQIDAATSPANYGGPVVDVKGRVVGLITPLSSTHDQPLGGVQWYDAGVGFAVPIDDILYNVPRLAGGDDLYPGRLGVGFTPGDPNTTDTVVAACHPGSPVYKTLKPGDRVIAVGDIPVHRVAELADALGLHYAGDKVTVRFDRDGVSKEHQFTLVDKLPPYDRPFLGILPRRDATADGRSVAVRYVYPGSPAAKAGIGVGDVLVSLNGKPLDGADDLRHQIALLLPGDEVTVDLTRSGAKQTVTTRLGRMSGQLVKGPLSPSKSQLDKSVTHGKVNISVPEIPNKAWAYVPKSCGTKSPCGVVVWLNATGNVGETAIRKRWRPVCDSRGLILLVVSPFQKGQWLPGEEAVVARMLEELIARYPVDTNRVVVHAYQRDVLQAAALAFRQRELIRAVAVVDPLPMGNIPPTDPLHPLAFYVVTFNDSPNTSAFKRWLRTVREARHPIEHQSIDAMPRYLEEEEVSRVAKWIDTLDQI